MSGQKKTDTDRVSVAEAAASSNQANAPEPSKPGKLAALMAAAQAAYERTEHKITDRAIEIKQAIDQSLAGLSVMVGAHGTLEQATARQHALQVAAEEAAKAEAQRKIVPHGFAGADAPAISFEEFKARPVNQRSHVALKAVHAERGWNTSDAIIWKEQWDAYRGPKR